MGVDLGDALFKTSNQINPKGSWEDVEVETLSDQILFSLGLDYFKSDLSPKKTQVQVPDFLKDKALSIISEKVERSHLYGFKDIRTWKLLPFWKEIFKKLSLDPVYLLAIRNPIDVVSSFHNLGNKNSGRAYLLWLDSAITMMTETDGEKRLVVEYSQLMEDPSKQIHRIAKK